STTYSNHFSQNDRNSAKLLVTITNKGAELDLSQAKSVRMSFRKPDGTRVFQNDCQPINAMKGKYQIVLKTQTLTSVGNVIAQIHIEEEDRILDTQKFFFVVNDSLSSDEAIESTNEFTIIQKAIEAGKKLEGVDINGIIAAGELAKGALPKTGGTMTGPLDIDNNIIMRLKGETGKRDWLVFRDSAHESVVFAPRLADNSDWDWSKQIEFRPDNFIVNGSTNLMKKTDYTAKDGRADLVLTADAANFDTSRPPGAVRRGNTVTIRGAIGVSASATANLVTTLPTDMRPIDSLTQTILTNDGSATTLEVYPDGRVILSNSAKGKNIYIVFTYVVD
ncbi:BppU family phage baseplate upper protein, partial [Bacillus cereus group sp. BfR-BA-01033]|uniref:BppU family phage baseplate upper protein n=1 Tax=Bacillus cereus group sp. BfR-BA-01033 TaxID=3094874 RepID=UPI0029C45A39